MSPGYFSLKLLYDYSRVEIHMKPVVINKTLCIGCGLCRQVCPYRAIDIVDGVAKYQIESCFTCGHCQAVCPEKAIHIADQYFPVEEMSRNLHGVSTDSERHSTKLLVDIMAGRRSCRNYKDKTVPLSVLKALVAIGITAPSGTNCQPWNFTLLPQRSDMLAFGSLIGDYFKRLNRLCESRLLRLLTKVVTKGSLNRYYESHYHSVKEAIEDWDERGEDRLFHGASAAILVTAKTHASCPGEDALLATQNILLAAHSMGLGTCLIGFAVEAAKRDKGIGRALGIPDDEKLYAVIALGYPKIEYPRPATRKKVIPRVFRFDKGGER